MKNKAFIPVILVSILLSFATARSEPEKFAVHKTPRPIPVVQFQNEKGETRSLADYKGKIVLLNIWATWCGPCVRALPEYEKVMNELDRSKVQFIAVNQEEKEGLIKAFAERKKMKLPIGLDPEGKVGKIFNCENLPQTVIIGPDGKIAWLHVGYKAGVAEALKAKVLELVGTGPTAAGSSSPAAE